MQSSFGCISDPAGEVGLNFPLRILAVPTHCSQLPLSDRTCTLTKVSILFNLQLQDAVRNDCAGRNLQGDVAVYFNAVAFLQAHLERCLKLG